jgi:DNA-directed RNA polymerase specialized sigma24 family protein
VFELVRFQGLTHVETAAIVGVSVKTVQRRLNHARLLLAEELADLRPGGGSAETPGDTPTS